jgi:hypothetical protein
MRFDIKKMTKFELNLGSKEQKIRYWLGCGMLLVSVVLANIPLLIVGGMLTASAYTRWCPIYSGLGKNSLDRPEPLEPPKAGDGPSSSEA